MLRQYGINVVNLLPRSWGPNGMERAVMIAEESGFDGIHFLPLRGWKTTKMERYENKVISYQDAWNHGTLLEAVGRQLFGNKKGPLIKDWALFANRVSPVFPHAVYNIVKLSGYIALDFVIEIHPGFSTEIETYVDLCTKGNHLCWDTWHVRRSGLDPDDRIKDWEHLLVELPDGAIRLIHIHLFPWEFKRFFQGNGETVDMLKKLKEKAPEVPAIVEVEKLLLKPKKDVIEFLSSIREAAKQYLG